MSQAKKHNIKYIIFLSAVAALGGFLFGYDTAVISGTIKSVTGQFNLNEMQAGWYVGCALLGSIGGVIFAGKLSDLFGRKPVLFVSAIMFSASAIGCMLSTDIGLLTIYRIIGGIGIGVASIISPLYISEISVAEHRGRLVTLYQLAITVGFLGAYLINYVLQQQAQELMSSSLTDGWASKIFASEVWRAMLGAESIPALLFFALLFFIPESPRWLLTKGHSTKARSILIRIYGKDEAKRQEQEVQKNTDKDTRSDWKILLQKNYRLPIVIGVCLGILGQFMGVNAVLYYGPSIFEQTGLSQDNSLFYQIFIGLINVVATLIAIAIIDKIGRKKLVYYGVSGMFISLICIGMYFFFNQTENVIPPVTLLILMLVYIFCCAISICVVIWVLLSEMYPTRIRGAAMSLAGLSLWIGTFLIGQLTPWLMSTLSPMGVFFLFAVMCIPYLWIVWKLVPETTGKSLEEIERLWDK